MRGKEIFKIYVVEDDIYYNRLLTKYLNNLSKIGNYPDLKIEVQSFHTAEECLENLEDDVNLILLDYYLDSDVETELSGMDVLREIKSTAKNSKVVIISGQQNMLTTIELLRNGAYDYVVKDENSLNRMGSVVQKIISEELALHH